MMGSVLCWAHCGNYINRLCIPSVYSGLWSLYSVLVLSIMDPVSHFSGVRYCTLEGNSVFAIWTDSVFGLMWDRFWVIGPSSVFRPNVIIEYICVPAHVFFFYKPKLV